MTHSSKTALSDEQPVSGAVNERVETGTQRPARSGIDGPIEKDRKDYKTHYGETAYGGGQKRYGGQPPVEEQHSVSERPRDAGRPEGKAGSKATRPGAGADHGPPEGE